MAAARPKETEVTQFRARPWPVPVGCEADLRAKREAALRSVEVDPALDFQDLLEMLKWHIDRREHQRARSSGTVAPPRAGEDVPRTFDLFAQESWRSQMWGSCHMPVDKHQLMNAEADAAFADLKARMCANGWMVGEDTCAAVRAMVMWLMQHDLDGLRFLIREGLLHVGGDLFPPCTQEWQHDSGSEAESLLSLAAKDTCSPAAVRLLLDHGADPNGELVPRSFNGGYLPTCGSGALACLDVRGEWPAFPADKLAILTALASAGGETLEACEEYRNATGHEAARAVCNQLFQEELERASRDARQRLETVVALVGIVSFWRRVAAAPDSKAAKAAIARAAKRARAWT